MALTQLQLRFCNFLVNNEACIDLPSVAYRAAKGTIGIVPKQEIEIMMRSQEVKAYIRYLRIKNVRKINRFKKKSRSIERLSLTEYNSAVDSIAYIGLDKPKNITEREEAFCLNVADRLNYKLIVPGSISFVGKCYAKAFSGSFFEEGTETALGIQLLANDRIVERIKHIRKIQDDWGAQVDNNEFVRFLDDLQSLQKQQTAMQEKSIREEV